jgi:hypothetical protein
MIFLICCDVMHVSYRHFGPIVCSETSVTNYQSALRNNPEECRSHCWTYLVFGLQGNLQDKLNKFGGGTVLSIISLFVYVYICLYV